MLHNALVHTLVQSLLHLRKWREKKHWQKKQITFLQTIPPNNYSYNWWQFSPTSFLFHHSIICARNEPCQSTFNSAPISINLLSIHRTNLELPSIKENQYHQYKQTTFIYKEHHVTTLYHQLNKHTHTETLLVEKKRNTKHMLQQKELPVTHP